MAARDFAKIADAYRVLGNRQTRAEYDKQLLRAEYADFGLKSSILSSENPHAQRARQLQYEQRYNAIIDRMIADEREQTTAFQRVLFPLVSIFASTFFVFLFRPNLWEQIGVVGKIFVVTLFVIGVIHTATRLSEGLERYTYRNIDIHDTILQEMEPEMRPYSRIRAISLFILAIFAFSLLGFAAGYFLRQIGSGDIPQLASSNLSFEFIFYPPICALFIDLMHTVFTRLER